MLSSASSLAALGGASLAYLHLISVDDNNIVGNTCVRPGATIGATFEFYEVLITEKILLVKFHV